VSDNSLFRFKKDNIRIHVYFFFWREGVRSQLHCYVAHLVVLRDISIKTQKTDSKAGGAAT
jgi:hypothetical protein